MKQYKQIQLGEFKMPLSDATSAWVEEYYQVVNKTPMSEDTINITNMDMAQKIYILGRILDFETKIIPSLFSEEDFQYIPNNQARDKHNAYFAKINMLYKFNDNRERKGKLTTELEYESLAKILALTDIYKREMHELFDTYVYNRVASEPTFRIKQ